MYRHVGCHHEHIKFCREGSYTVCTSLLTFCLWCTTAWWTNYAHADTATWSKSPISDLLCLHAWLCDRLHHLHAIVLWFATVIHVLILMVQI